jgi:hypothetical protein
MARSLAAWPLRVVHMSPPEVSSEVKLTSSRHGPSGPLVASAPVFVSAVHVRLGSALTLQPFRDSRLVEATAASPQTAWRDAIG